MMPANYNLSVIDMSSNNFHAGQQPSTSTAAIVCDDPHPSTSALAVGSGVSGGHGQNSNLKIPTLSSRGMYWKSTPTKRLTTNRCVRFWPTQTDMERELCDRQSIAPCYVKMDKNETKTILSGHQKFHPNLSRTAVLLISNS